MVKIVGVYLVPLKARPGDKPYHINFRRRPKPHAYENSDPDCLRIEKTVWDELELDMVKKEMNWLYGKFGYKLDRLDLRDVD